MSTHPDISLLFPRRKGSPLFKSTLEKFEKRIDSKDPRKDPIHQQAGDKAKEGIKEHIQDLESSAKWGEIGAESEARIRDVASQQTERGVRGAATGGKFADVASETTEAYASFKGDQAAADVAEQDKYRMIKEERETTLTQERELAEDNYSNYLQSVQDYDTQMSYNELTLATSFKQTAQTAVTGMMQKYDERDLEDTWFDDLEQSAADDYGGDMSLAIADYLKEELEVDTDWLQWEPGDLITTSQYDDGTYDYDFTANVFNEEGRDPEGLDISGNDEAGFSGETGLHQETGDAYNEAGVNVEGINKAGFNEENMFLNPDGSLSLRDEGGYDAEGVDEAGWTRDEINAETNEAYDIEGNDFAGYNKDTGVHKDTGLDIEGYDEAGFKEMEGATSGQMWNKAGVNKETGELTDSRGFTVGGVTESGEEFNERNFNVAGEFSDRYRNPTDDEGFDVDGNFMGTSWEPRTGEGEITKFNNEGYDRDGLHTDTGTPHDLDGWDVRDYHENGTRYDEEGYRRNGNSKMGFNREGTNYEGLTYDEKIDQTNNTISDLRQNIEDKNNYVNDRYSGDWFNASENNDSYIGNFADTYDGKYFEAERNNNQAEKSLWWAIGTSYGSDKYSIGGVKELYDKFFDSVRDNFGNKNTSLRNTFRELYGTRRSNGPGYIKDYSKFFKGLNITIYTQSGTAGSFTMDQINAGNFYDAGSKSAGYGNTSLGDITNDENVLRYESKITGYNEEKNRYGF